MRLKRKNMGWKWRLRFEKLEKEVAQLKQSTFCFKQEKEENGKRISELQMRIE